MKKPNDHAEPTKVECLKNKKTKQQHLTVICVDIIPIGNIVLVRNTSERGIFEQLRLIL